MGDDDWFDDEVGETLPANVARLPYPQRVEILPSLDDLEGITVALSVLAVERKHHPDLVNLLEKYPLLLGEYLTLPLREKMALEEFRQTDLAYFEDRSWNGDSIRKLTDKRTSRHQAAAMVARKYRWAEQLGKMLDFYLQGDTSVAFNNNYLRANPELRKKFGSLGNTLVQNLYQNDLQVSDLVAVVASARPEILIWYREPGYQSNVAYHPAVRK